MIFKNINKRPVLLSLLVMVLLGSCKIGKEYTQPAVELPQQFSTISYADTNSIADIEWKNFFSDTTLQNLITKGLQYNQDLLIAVKNIEIAQQRVKESKNLNLPEVDLFVSGQYSRPSDNSLNGISASSFLGKSHIENYQAGVNLSWEADIWGKIRQQKTVALAEYLQTTEAVKAVQTKLVADISQGYFTLLMLDEQLKVTKENLALSDTFLTSTRLLKDAGLANALAVQRAESQLQSTAILIPQLEENIAIQENALQILTGQLPGTVTRKTSLDDITIQKDLNAGVPAALLSRRPDIRSTEQALIAANARVGIAQASMYPALNITAGAGLESFKSSNWFNIPGSLFGIAAGTIAQPIFKRRSLKTNYEVAKLEREQAVIVFRQSVLNATGEVVNALVQVDKLSEQEKIALERVTTLQNAVVNAQLLFKSDMANYLEVINAQSNSLVAQLSLVEVQRSKLAAAVELYRSLGGGWR